MSLIDCELYMNDVIRVANEFDNFKNSKVLITGASGLICSFLVDVLMYRNLHYGDNIYIYLMCRNEKKLKERFNYYNLNELNIIIQDICESFDFDYDFDYIINGASNTHPIQYSTNPVGTITTNVMGLNNILKYSIKHKPKRIFMMSSVEIYGENKGDVDLFDENYLGYINCNTVRACYPESKRVCESLCQSYISQYGLDIVIGRLSRVFGPTMQKDDSKALAQFIRNAVDGKDIILKSDGKQLFSYTYMSDAVSAILKILFYGECGEAYNISDRLSDITLKDLACILAKYNNKKVVFELPTNTEKKGYSTATKAVLDSAKIRKLGWKPYYNIETGLQNTVKILKKMECDENTKYKKQY